MGKNPEGWGDFFRLWSKLWLEDEDLNDEEQAWYLRTLCAGHEVDWKRGRFQIADIPLSKDQICAKAKINQDHFDRLILKGKIEVIKTAGKTAIDLFILKNWEYYQNKERLHRYHNKTADIPAHNTPEKEKEDVNEKGNTPTTTPAVNQPPFTPKAKPVKKTYMQKMKEQWDKEALEAQQSKPIEPLPEF